MFSATEKIIVSKGSFLQYTLQLISHLNFLYLQEENQHINQKDWYQAA